jgi:hypothetical protein
MLYPTKPRRVLVPLYQEERDVGAQDQNQRHVCEDRHEGRRVGQGRGVHALEHHWLHLAEHPGKASASDTSSTGVAHG